MVEQGKARSVLGRYLALTFVACWGWAGAFYLAGIEYGGMMTYAIALPYMLFPAIAAIVVDRRDGRAVRESLWLKFGVNRWWLVAWFLPVVLAFAALFGALLLPGVGFDVGMGGILESLRQMLGPQEYAEAKAVLERFPPLIFFVIQLVQGVVVGATFNAFFALGEEAGWRGLMLRELAGRGFWTSALIIGAVWGVWHAPLILQGHNYPEHPVLGVGLMTLWCVLLSPLFSWATLKSGSVIAAAVMHGTLNATAAFSFLYLDHTIPLVTGLHGLVGVGVLVVANVLLWALARPTLEAGDWEKLRGGRRAESEGA
ncbi:CPBP family intramembrane metalloprotease domain-containing protein [Lujinxingia litoralis]|uniref:CPBP family intramembrane metalloprotease domain-containing protein n=1 Tax=Lujinxingia litoralis TaxID=2211119 RepID=A0A328CA07_9DELT|nr:CPBP family intramembrane glutamic endopeptidase [Lujinxingia litoralis]RAL24778.1 CPBP family intramembrane metalloprotease domain-containing protein [Lujinxingia litoralis]